MFIESLKIARIEDIIVVISRGKHAIPDYLGSGKRLGVRLTYVVQGERTGLSKAVEAGQHLIDGTFIVVNGDNFFDPKTVLKDVIAYHFEEGADATLGAFEAEDVTRHGILGTEDNRFVDIVENPSPENAPSNLGDAEMHVLEPIIFDAIKRLEVGIENEYQLTDVLDFLLYMRKKVNFKEIEMHIDIGTLQDLRRANRVLTEQRRR